MFGCLCFDHLTSNEWNKLSTESSQCAFLDYAANQKGFLYYDAITRRICTSWNVILVENQLFLKHHWVPLPSSLNSLIYDFTGSSPTTRFKPVVVYLCRGRRGATTKEDPEWELLSAPDLDLDPLPLWRSTHPCRPPDCYGVLVCHSLLPCPLSPSLTPIRCLWNKMISNMQCRKSLISSRQILCRMSLGVRMALAHWM